MVRNKHIANLKSSSIIKKKVKVKWSRYRPGVAQRVARVIALLFHDRGTRRGWVVSSTPRPHFTHEKDPVPIVQEAGWAPGPVWKDGKSRPHRDLIPYHPARSQSLYRQSYPADKRNEYQEYFLGDKGGRCLGLTIIPPSCAEYLEIWETHPPAALRACPGL
jgi:hypothetical protein